MSRTVLALLIAGMICVTILVSVVVGASILDDGESPAPCNEVWEDC